MSSKRLGPPPPPQPKVDFSLATDVVCEVCKNYTFTEVLLMKHFSDVASPTGKGGYVPIPTHACNACGYVNTDFLPPFMRPKKDDAPQENKEQSTLTAPVPSPTKIEIVR